jgi:hypothetical protein
LDEEDETVQEAMQMINQAGQAPMVNKNDHPGLALFCKEMTHESTHVLQEAGLDVDYNQRVAKITRMRNSQNPTERENAEQILTNARAQLSQLKQNPDWQDPNQKSDQDVLKEVQADLLANQSDLDNLKEKSGAPTKWQSLLADFDQATKPKTGNKQAMNELMRRGAQVRGAVGEKETKAPGSVISDTDEQLEEKGGRRAEQEKDAQIKAETVLEKLNKIRGNFGTFNNMASTFKDEKFLKQASGFEFDLEKLGKILMEQQGLDTPEANGFRNAANDYLDNILIELDKATDDLKNYNENGNFGFFHSLWLSTYFVSLNDILAIGMTAYEWGQRRYKRKQDNRIGQIGTQLFNKSRFTETLAQDFTSKVQGAENEEVNKFKDIMANWGIDQVIDALHHPGANRDMFKASFIDLVNRGNLEPQWTDPTVWKNLSKFSGLPVYNKKTAKAAVDKLWGINTAADWSSQDISNMESRASKAEATAKIEGNLRGVYDTWLDDLRKWNAGGKSDASLRPDYTQMMGIIKLDLLFGGISGSTTLPRVQELILLGGLPPHAVNGLIMGMQNQAPVFTLFTREQAEAFGLFEAIGYDPQNDPYNVAGRKKLYEFLAGERALPIKYNINSLRENKKTETPIWQTVHDFQAGRKTGSNRTSAQLGDFDQEHMEYIFPGSARYQLTSLLTPTMDGEDKLNEKRVAGGVIGLLKTIKAYSEAAKNDPEGCKRRLKQQVRHLLTVIEFSKRSNKRQWSKEIPEESFFEENPDRQDYQSHITENDRESPAHRNFNNRSASKWSPALVREKGIARMAKMAEDALSLATGVHVPLASEVVLNTDPQSSPMDHYVEIMQAIDRIG